MKTHVAILKEPYIDAVLAGTKFVESRFMRTRRAPFGHVAENDTIFLKQASGAIRAAARVAWVEHADQHDDPNWTTLRATHGKAIGADDAFWDAVLDRRYAMLVGLAEVRAVIAGPSIEHWTNRRSAWLTIDPAHTQGQTQAKADIGFKEAA